MAGINSYQKEKLILGKSYWTFYMDTTRKGNGLRNVTGVFEVIPKQQLHYKPSEYLDWEIKGGTYYREKHTCPITTYMNGYGTANCDFFETEAEAIEAHDKRVKYLAQGLNTHDRDVMFQKLIVKSLPPKPKIEIDSVAWYKGLSTTEKKYVQWIKEYYEEI